MEIEMKHLAAGLVAVLLLVATFMIGFSLNKEVEVPVVEELEVEVIKEVPVEANLLLIEELESELDNLLNEYEDVISQKDIEDEAYDIIKEEFEDKEFLESLKDYLVGEGFNVEHREDILDVRFEDKDDDYVDIEDDEGATGYIHSELRVTFRQDGLDGDRHRVEIGTDFALDEGELSHYNFI